MEVEREGLPAAGQELPSEKEEAEKAPQERAPPEAATLEEEAPSHDFAFYEWDYQEEPGARQGEPEAAVTTAKDEAPSAALEQLMGKSMYMSQLSKHLDAEATVALNPEMFGGIPRDSEFGSPPFREERRRRRLGRSVSIEPTPVSQTELRRRRRAYTADPTLMARGSEGDRSFRRLLTKLGLKGGQK